jgi:hypothetical protein
MSTDAADAWKDFLTALPPSFCPRRLRLWCVAWSRIYIQNGAAVYEEFRGECGWHPADAARVLGGLEAAEKFADGRIGRRELMWEKPTTGGPANALHLAFGVTRLNPVTVRDVLARLHLGPDSWWPSGRVLGELLRDIFGDPLRPVAFDPAWRNRTTMALARVMYDTRDFTAMPILADALQDAGCEHADILDHCRGDSPHVRGCWVVDLVRGKV